MSQSTELRLQAAISICTKVIESIGGDEWQDLVLDLIKINELLTCKQFENAIEIIRGLPRGALSGVYNKDTDWMDTLTEDDLSENLHMDACYVLALEALHDLRVHLLYGAERKIVDISDNAILQKKSELELNAKTAF
ncbi:hypothetical protein [Zooshikella sp. RANM57]|uniref:hypothetical protein n=1 Tax=Zooshikella sp. RANM57 TaxID=3425863 RepID=UPI003D6E66EB